MRGTLANLRLVIRCGSKEAAARSIVCQLAYCRVELSAFSIGFKLAIRWP